MNRFDVHRVFYGHKEELSNYQVRVYGSTRVRAVTGMGEDDQKLQLALVVALSQAFDPVMRSYHETFLFVPESLLEWARGRIQEMARSLTSRLREEASTSEQRALLKRVLRVLKDWLTSLKLLSPEKWLASPPPRWAAYGYTAADQVPRWVKTCLG